MITKLALVNARSNRP